MTICSKVLVLCCLLLVLPLALMAQDNFEVQIEKAMVSLRAGDYALSNSLPINAQIIPYMYKYLHDTDDRVGHFIVNVACRNVSEEGLLLLIKIITLDVNKSTSESACEVLYRYYPAKYYLDDKDKIRNVLLSHVKYNPRSFRSILILSTYNKDDIVIQAIKKHRDKIANDMIRGENWLPNVHEILIDDIALAELTDTKEDKEKVINYITKADIADVVYMLYTVNFITKTEILSQLTTLLTDKRDALRYIYTHPVSKVTYQRVCDFALNSLVNRAGIKLDFPERTYNYTDDELQSASIKLCSIWKQ